MMIAPIDYLTRNARELTRPMCFDLSRDARAAIACRVSLAYRTRPMCFPLNCVHMCHMPLYKL